MEHFVEHLQAPVINDKIFPNIVPGFLDSNPVIREQTIKVGSCLMSDGIVQCQSWLFLILLTLYSSNYVR